MSDEGEHAMPMLLIVALAAAAAPACPVATADDLRRIRIDRIQDDAYEQAAPAVSRRYGLSGADAFIVRFSWKQPSGHCVRLLWRAVPFGSNPASPRDFEGRSAGSITLAATSDPYDAGAPRPELVIVAPDDRLTESNETFRLELRDAAGRIIWGDISPRPEINGGLVLWHNRDRDPQGLIFTIHDIPRQCDVPLRGSGYTARLAGRRAAIGLVLARPADRPILRCADVPWRVVAGLGALPPSAFAGNRYPSGTAHFSSNSAGDPEDDIAVEIALALKDPRAARGKRVRLAWGGGNPPAALSDFVVP